GYPRANSNEAADPPSGATLPRSKNEALPHREGSGRRRILAAGSLPALHPNLPSEARKFHARCQPREVGQGCMPRSCIGSPCPVHHGGSWPESCPVAVAPFRRAGCWNHTDRKSTRLNSSHTVISYDVFC